MPAWEGCQEAEATLVSGGTSVPLSPSRNNCPRLLGVAKQAAYLSPTPTVAETWLELAHSPWKWELLRWCKQRVRIMPKDLLKCPCAYRRGILAPNPCLMLCAKVVLN